MDEAQRTLNVGHIFQMELRIPQGLAIIGLSGQGQPRQITSSIYVPDAQRTSHIFRYSTIQRFNRNSKHHGLKSVRVTVI